MDAKVLIVGAGPTGLVLALWLTKMGISVKIIDKSQGPGETSRAMIVQARTLEFYHQLGISEEVIKLGIKVNSLVLSKEKRKVATISFNEIGGELSPYPFILSFPQDDHEKLLVEVLEKLGVKVERNTELISFKQEKDKVIATLKIDNQEEIFSADYVCGCDGAHSIVRHQLNFNFAGGTYPQIFYVADVKTNSEIEMHDIQIGVSKNDFCLALPVRSSGSVRLIGIVPPDKAQKENLQFEDVKDSAVANNGLTIETVNWFAVYHVHHRVASQFMNDRVFILGDAAHIHSPAGGQGMNTGIGDAVNLAWKLANVLKQQANESILNTYETERVPFAKKLVKTTDQLFQIATNQNIIGKCWRDFVFPYVFPFAFNFKGLKTFFFRLLSQSGIEYHSSPLSEGSSGKLKGGDRLPYIVFPDKTNFDVLTSLNWQVHVYGKAYQNLLLTAKSWNLEVHEFPWDKTVQHAGIENNCALLIRPDGYIAVINPSQNVSEFEAFLNKWNMLK